MIKQQTKLTKKYKKYGCILDFGTYKISVSSGRVKFSRSSKVDTLHLATAKSSTCEQLQLREHGYQDVSFHSAYVSSFISPRMRAKTNIDNNIIILRKTFKKNSHLLGFITTIVLLCQLKLLLYLLKLTQHELYFNVLANFICFDFLLSLVELCSLS